MVIGRLLAFKKLASIYKYNHWTSRLKWLRISWLSCQWWLSGIGWCQEPKVVPSTDKRYSDVRTGSASNSLRFWNPLFWYHIFKRVISRKLIKDSHLYINCAWFSWGIQHQGFVWWGRQSIYHDWGSCEQLDEGLMRIYSSQIDHKFQLLFHFETLHQGNDQLCTELVFKTWTKIITFNI